MHLLYATDWTVLYSSENDPIFQIPVDSLSCLLQILLFLPFACSHLSGSSALSWNGQTLLVCRDDVIVKSLIELRDDVTPADRREKAQRTCSLMKHMYTMEIPR